MSEFSFPLISADTLNSLLGNENLLILDASIPPVGTNVPPEHGWPEYAIGNARRFDIEGEFSDHQARFPHTMISPARFELLCQQLGINNEHQIVVYDNLGLFSAARAWWMFKSMGHENITVLDGGLPNWLKNGFPTKKVERRSLVDSNVKGNFASSFNAELFVNCQQVLAAIDDQNSLILDARAQARFLGQAPEPRPGVRAGHMPSAKNLPYSTLLDNDLLLPAAELVYRFEKINPKNQPMIMSCGSGITACILALAATIAGYKNIKIYDGSWAEWGSLPDCPVITH